MVMRWMRDALVPQALQGWAREVRRDTLAIAFALRDPRTPWFAKVLGAAVVAYAVSPIDLIPDFIPVLGYVDDLLIVPAGLLLVRRMIPAEVLAEHRLRAERTSTRLRSLAGMAFIISVWVLVVGFVLWWFWR